MLCYTILYYYAATHWYAGSVVASFVTHQRGGIVKGGIRIACANQPMHHGTLCVLLGTYGKPQQQLTTCYVLCSQAAC